VSQAFVKNDADTPEEPVKRQPSGRPNYVTVTGLAQLEAKLLELTLLRAELLAQKRPDEPGGLPLRQAEIDLSYFETQVKQAKVVDNRGLDSDEVRFGATVVISENGGPAKEFVIVGEDEADAAAGKLNWASPLAAVLLGARKGAKVTWARKTGDAVIEILSVTYPKA